MKASDHQVGGSHYKNFHIQPGEFCEKNGLSGMTTDIIKRLCSFENGGELQELEKAVHEAQLKLQWQTELREGRELDFESKTHLENYFS